MHFYYLVVISVVSHIQHLFFSCYEFFFSRKTRKIQDLKHFGCEGNCVVDVHSNSLKSLSIRAVTGSGTKTTFFGCFDNTIQSGYRIRYDSQGIYIISGILCSNLKFHVYDVFFMFSFFSVLKKTINNGLFPFTLLLIVYNVVLGRLVVSER